MMASLLKEAEIYGLSIYGDGATIRRMPLINVLAAGVHNPAAVLEIANCTKQMEDGKKKDATYIAGLFKPHIEEFEKVKKDCVDCAFFDGASNVQKAGEIMEAKYPRITVMHGAEHVVSLFYADIFKIPEFLLLKKFNRLLYKFFGSGSMHLPYALFQKQSKAHNNGRNVGFIRSSDTRMGGHVISMMRSLRLKDALMSTVGTAEFLQGKIRIDRKHLSLVKSHEYWDIMRILVRAVFPMLLVLRLADRKSPVMDKLYFYVRRMDNTMEKSKRLLDGISSVTSHRNEFSSMLRSVASMGDDDSDDDDDSDESECEEDDDDEDEDDEDAPTAPTLSLGDKVAFYWSRRRPSLVSSYAIAGWMLCPIPEVMDDATKYNTGQDRITIENLLKKLYGGGLEEDCDKVSELLNTFWTEFDQFQLKEGPYNRPHIWNPNNGDILRGESHVWHKKNSLPHTEVLGKFACRVCSKIAGIGSAERAWGDVKHLKSEKRSHLGTNALKKQSTIFGASCMEAAARTAATKSPGEALKVWTDEDFDSEFDMLASTNTAEVTKPRRVLRCYVEEWERATSQKRDPVAEAKLLKKYGGLQFKDVDKNAHTNKMFYCDPDKLNWSRRSKRGGGYSVIGYSEDYDEDDQDKEDHIEYFVIVDGDEPCSAIHDLARMYYTSHPEKGVKVITIEDAQKETDVQDDDEEETDTDEPQEADDPQYAL
jgi:hypothetical protein